MGSSVEVAPRVYSQSRRGRIGYRIMGFFLIADGVGFECLLSIHTNIYARLIEGFRN